MVSDEGDMTMKVNNYFVRFYVIIISILLFPVISPATVREVTLYPNAAKITEAVKINPLCDKAKCTAILTLPPQSDPESLAFLTETGSSATINDIQIKSIPVQYEARIAELQKKLTAAEGEKKETKAKLQALEAQIQFWQSQTKTKTKTIADSYKLADAIGRNIQKSNQEKFTAETQLEKTEKNIRKIQEALDQTSGKKENAWEITLHMSGAGQKEMSLSYTYLLAGCGWRPLYRLEALPGNNKVFFTWQAEVWQSSGSDWNQVQLNLATLQPVLNVEPREMPDWIIKPLRLYKTTSRKAAEAAPLMNEASVAEDEGLGAESVETRNTTFSVWSLGKRNVAAGGKQYLKIKDDSWPAEFLFLARPALNSQAFVRASVKLNQPAEIPAGQAMFVIEGATLGKREFSFAGSEGTLFFGTSPFITVTSKTVADQADEKTIFQDKQTRSWQWLIEARNNGSSDVKLRIEEPVPQARDKRIKLDFQQNPEPLEKDHAKFVWLLDVPAKQTKTIHNKIELEAPNDLNLDFGWR